MSAQENAREYLIPVHGGLASPVDRVVPISRRVAFAGRLLAPLNQDTGLFAKRGGRPAFAFAVEGSAAPGAPGAVFGDFYDFVLQPVFGSDAAGNVAFTLGLEFNR